MLCHSLGERAKDNAQIRELAAKRSGHRDAIKNGVDSYASQSLLFLERNAQLFVSSQ
jgi:hypothetical protein